MTQAFNYVHQEAFSLNLALCGRDVVALKPVTGTFNVLLGTLDQPESCGTGGAFTTLRSWQAQKSLKHQHLSDGSVLPEPCLVIVLSSHCHYLNCTF